MPSVSDTAMLSRKGRAAADEIDDGRKSLYKIYVDTKVITAGDFDLCWRTADLINPPTDVVEPFIQTLHEKGIYLIDKSLRLLSDKSRVAYLPLDRFMTWILTLARGFPAEVCRRWCALCCRLTAWSKSILGVGHGQIRSTSRRPKNSPRPPPIACCGMSLSSQAT